MGGHSHDCKQDYHQQHAQRAPHDRQRTRPPPLETKYNGIDSPGGSLREGEETETLSIETCFVCAVGGGQGSDTLAGPARGIIAIAILTIGDARSVRCLISEREVAAFSINLTRSGRRCGSCTSCMRANRSAGLGDGIIPHYAKVGQKSIVDLALTCFGCLKQAHFQSVSLLYIYIYHHRW